MLRPNIEECLNLWFGKSEQTDQEIWNRFGADVALASRGHYDHWALDVEHPRLLVALVIMLDQFPRNMYRDTPQMYACDARCRALVKRGLRVGVSARLRPIERVFLCLVLTHSEALDDQHLCMEEWGRAMDELAPDDPLNAFHEIFHRHVAVIKRFGRFPHRNKILQRANTAAEEDFLGEQLVPLRPAADPAAGRRVRVRRHGEEAHREAARPRVPDPAAGRRRGAARGVRVQVCGTGQRLHQDAGAARRSRATSASATAFPTSPPRPAWARSTSTSSSATPGACSSRTRRTSRRYAPPSSGPRPSSQPEWSKRGVKVIGLSVDSAEDHERWIADINETQHTQVNFPIIADKDRRVSMLFGMLDPTTFRHGSSLGETMTVRSVFIISPSKRVELILSYPAYIGRNFDEILRVLDALQLSAKYRVATPANWQPGDDTVVLPFISDEEAERMFADQGGFRKVRSYLRFVRDPSLRCL